MRMLNNAQIWAFELAIFLATGVYAVGGVYALSRRAHVSLDLITARISERKVAILNSITWPFALLFIGVIMWRGFGTAVESFMIRETTATGWDPPLWPMRW